MGKKGMFVHWCVELCICTHIYIHFCIICVHTFDVSKSCSVATTALSLFYGKTSMIASVCLFKKKKCTSAFVTFSSKTVG